jgi:riboflavin biosynthesis pyrimidine reductase
LLLQVTDAFGSYKESDSVVLKELVSGFSITASLVCDAAGSTVSPSGSSAGLGNKTDLALLVALRRQAQVILTSGSTFRADKYRFPKHADLAVLSNRSVDIEVPAGQELLIKHSGYREALQDLKGSGYSRIHVEYGLTGISALAQAGDLDALSLSSPFPSGVKALSDQMMLKPTIIELSDLCIGLVAWQPTMVRA